MNEANFVKRMNWIATGDSFLKEMVLSVVGNLMDDSGPDVLDGASAPELLLDGASFGTGEIALLSFQLPMDYDQDGDRMVLRMLIQPDANASNFDINTTKRFWRAGVVVNTTNGTAKGETSTTSASLAREVHLSMSGDSHQPGDSIQRSIVATCTVASIVALSIIYGSSFAAYNNDDRHRDMAASTA